MRYIAYLRQLKKRKTPLICQLSHDCNRVHQIPAFQHFNFQSFLQHTPNDSKSSFRANDSIRIVFVIRNQNRLHVEPSVAVRKCVTVALVRLPLPIGFQIALTVIDEHTDLAYRERLAPLYPDDLPVMVDRLHTVAGYSNAKVRFRRNRVFRKTDHLKVVLIQETACTG